MVEEQRELLVEEEGEAGCTDLLYGFLSKSASAWRGACLLCHCDAPGRAGVRCPFASHCVGAALPSVALAPPLPRCSDDTTWPLARYMKVRGMAPLRLRLCASLHAGPRGKQARRGCANQCAHNVAVLLEPFGGKALLRYFKHNLRRMDDDEHAPRWPLRLNALDRFACRQCRATRLSGPVHLQDREGRPRAPVAVLYCSACAVTTFACIYEPVR